jgi:hypothetical protein
VASLILVPEGQAGRPSKAMTLDQAIQLLDLPAKDLQDLSVQINLKTPATIK